MEFDFKSCEFISQLVHANSLPRMAYVRQHFDGQKIEDVSLALIKEFEREEVRRQLSLVKRGQSVAITAGSRQIRNLSVMVKTVVDEIRKLGGNPYIIPSMGSHGGATAQGQQQMLESYGITEKAMGCPIKSDMATVKIGQAPDGKEVFIDRNAAGSDHIVLINRIKPHTCFRGPYESGLMKMMAIGLGKQHGAEICHNDGFGKMTKNIEAFGRVILRKAPILLGIGVVENSADQTCMVRVLTPGEIPEEEPKLLEIARARMPKILLPSCDILVVDAMGKNFSGSGMDPNVTGRFVTKFASGGMEAQRMCVLDLSDASHGNCIGVGTADVTTKRLYDKAKPALAYINGMTSLVIEGTKIPMVMKNDEEAILACLRTCTCIDRKNPRIIRIPNTLELTRIQVSEALKQEVLANENLELVSGFKELAFDGEGNLLPFAKES